MDNSDCKLFYDRFILYNQFIVETNFQDKQEFHHCFKHGERYHTSINASVNEKYIVNVKKKNSGL